MIDDGVNEARYDIGPLLHNIEITAALEIRSRYEYDHTLRSHGSTCAAIIRKYAPDAALCSIKILDDDSKKGLKDQLIKALNWCMDNGIDLINLSLGTIYYRDFDDLKATVDAVLDKGIIIVAACNNRNVYTCPASLPGVIGVKCDISGNLGEGEFVYNSFAPDGIDMTACSSHNLVDHEGNSRITGCCNSFAAPMITAVVHEMMKRNPGIASEGIRAELIERSVRQPVDTNGICLTNTEGKSINVPIMVIYDDETRNKAVLTARRLKDLFRSDGYNSVAVVTYAYDEQANEVQADEEPADGILNLADYTGNDAAGDMSGCLKTLYSVYDPDVIIVVTDDPVEIRCIDEYFGIDVIILPDSKNADGIIKRLVDIDDTKVIMFMDDPVGIKRGDNESMHEKRINIAKLYANIIGLFQECKQCE